MENMKPILNSKQMSSKFYNPSKHLAVDDVIFLLKGTVVSKQYAKETQMFQHKNIQTMLFH
jgi:hypothetical protein